MKRSILILGSTGLLGNAIASFFISRAEKYDVVTTYRDPSVAFPGNSIYFDALSSPLDGLPKDIDYVINCIGVIKPFMSQSTENAIIINSLFPWRLSDWCSKNDTRLIHITTDCVFSGKKGKYVESDLHDALDAYGKSKSLGECTDSAMVLRTSIIGEEIHKNASLIAWAKSQKGKSVKGFMTHLWNGVTTGEYAKICDKIIRNDWYDPGLFHIFARDDVSKYEMLEMFSRKFDLGLDIEKADPPACDRTLRSEKGLCAKLEIPTVQEMIEVL